MKSNPKNQLILTKIITGTGLIALSLMIITLQQNPTSADTTSTSRASVIVPASCTFSDTTTDGNYAVSITPGSYNDNIGNHEFQIFCNDSNGFSVYAIGYSNDQYGNTDMINSNSTHSNIATGLATSGSYSAWAMKLTPVTGTYAPTISNGTNGTENFTTFHTVPSTFTKVATFPSLTDATIGSKFQTTYRIYASPTQPAGTYTGKVKYVIVHPSSHGVPKFYMQDLTSTSLAALLPNIGSTATVYDKRDEQAYTIAKLEDGKYWMVENLNLAGGTTISCDTSDCENYTIPTDNGWQSGGKLPESSTTGFDTANYAYVYNSGNKTNNCAAPGCYSYYSWDVATLGSGRAISTENTNAPYSICPKGWKLPSTYNGSGVAAEAADFRKLIIALGGSNSLQTYTPSSDPTGATLYGKLTASPYNFLLAGAYNSSALAYGGSYGGYWSSTSHPSNINARSLGFTPTHTYLTNYNSRGGGFSVRCVAR